MDLDLTAACCDNISSLLWFQSVEFDYEIFGTVVGVALIQKCAVPRASLVESIKYLVEKLEITE